ncbi:probable LIM domain-containing serine/threonine-protein kinase DDB_G0287001 [Corticium candelabrum]|uniref:probable LIM domain-containing serine/threonine-protein kinase DDB_G0287001 n=1 Tax=Corticium candelabrum TaxID=121492 RepID=UPI002E26C9EF|nr:probable LIM domain-containing serine/threonine-protein kinase DDB_G0287001 [Corticium candelabrum]
MRDLSEDGIGTVRWSAPELARRESYDGSIDVYSFGIVLWKIWSRGFPFEQYRFAHQVDDAVERGERPVVPDDCPEEYSTVMQACWAERARKRPSFSEVVSSLENMHVEDAC